jgi:RNA polymerase sigma factor (sigma-70 family)
MNARGQPSGTPRGHLRVVPRATSGRGELDLADDRLAARAGDGDEHAFELLFERHHGVLLSFCRHMLGSREEGEDALQQTFMRAVEALRAGRRPEHVRAWLFAIARNRCLTLLVARRERRTDELADVPDTDGLVEQVARRDELRDLLSDLARLPDDQRAALVLAELGDLSQARIGDVLGVPEARVKALIYQARQNLIAEREARSASCDAIRAELAVARGPQLRRGSLRRHLRRCAGCRAFRRKVGAQQGALAVVLPVVAAPELRARVLEAVGGLAGGSGAAGGAAVVGAHVATVAGTGAATKIAALVAAAGLATAGGAALPDRDRADPRPGPAPARATMSAAPAAVPAEGSTRTVAEDGASDRPGSRGSGRAAKHGQQRGKRHGRQGAAAAKHRKAKRAKVERAHPAHPPRGAGRRIRGKGAQPRAAKPPAVAAPRSAAKPPATPKLPQATKPPRVRPPSPAVTK